MKTPKPKLLWNAGAQMKELGLQNSFKGQNQPLPATEGLVVDEDIPERLTFNGHCY